MDENVVIAASKGSGTAATLLMHIVKNCHRIAVNTRLMESYQQNLRRHRKATPLEVPKLVGQLTHHAEKCCFVPEATPGRTRIPIRHPKDVFLVEIAKAVGSGSTYIVTSDKMTLKDINAKTGLRAVTIGEALRYARKADG